MRTKDYKLILVASSLRTQH